MENWKFFKRDYFIECNDCPIKKKYSFCDFMDSLSIEYEDVSMACHGAILNWLFERAE
jgi:hypothetical protein